MIYRQEIDGLRAVAIVSVLVFHFFPSYLPLGYLGVDLFFVISGYLISRILISGLENNTFSFKSFYVRRVKRILPATLIVLLATSLASVFLLIASDLVRYATSLFATLAFVANIHFWRAGGYFGVNDELKPLLHMWSLGVEEQFYLVFPLILFLILKFVGNRSLQLLLVVLLTAGSYALNTYLLSIGGANPAFFLLPTRAWQFGVGGICAFASSCSFMRTGSVKIIPLVGIGLIAANFHFALPRFPAATMMSVGVGALLWQRFPLDSIVGKVLTFGPVRFIGLISFSLYLWHWQIVVYLKYVFVEGPPISFTLVALVSTFVLAWLSWKYVEEPFRKRIATRRVFILVGSTYIVLFSFIGSIYLGQGFPSRHAALANTAAKAVGSNYRCPVESYRSYGGSRACIVGEAPRNDYMTVLLGNSHAQMYGPAFVNALNKIGRKGLIVPLNNCLPTIDINISIDCLRLARLNYDAIMADANVKVVVIALTWYVDKLVAADGVEIQDTDFKYRENSLVSLIKDFELSGRSAFLIGPIPTPGFDFASVVSRRIVYGKGGDVVFSVPRKSFDEKYGSVLKNLKSRLGPKMLFPHNFLCDSQNCHFGSKSEIFFADSSHLSLEGAKKMNRLFEDIIH